MCRKAFFKARAVSGWVLWSLWNYLKFLQNLHNLHLKALWLLWALGHGQFSMAGKSGVSRIQYWAFCFERISLRAAKGGYCSAHCVVSWSFGCESGKKFSNFNTIPCSVYITYFTPNNPCDFHRRNKTEIPCHFLRLEAMAEACECEDGNFMTDNCIIKSSKLITGYHYTWSSLACLKNWLNPSLGRISIAKGKCERKLILIPCNIKKWW